MAERDVFDLLNDDGITSEVTTPEPTQGVTLHPEPPRTPVTETATLPSQPPTRRSFNWWAVVSIILMLGIGVHLIRQYLPSGGGSGVNGLHVMIVYESDDLGDLPSKQAAIFSSTRLREWLDEACPEKYRLFDQDIPLEVDDPEHELWRSLMKRDRDSLPWIYAVGGKREVSKPLPGTVDETIKLLEGAK